MSFVILPEGIDLGHLKERLLDEIDKVTDDKDFWRCFNTMWSEEYSGEFDENDNPIDDEEKIITLKKAKSIFKDLVKEVFESLVGSRDVTWIIHKGDQIFMSGGMSWGDSPTDNYVAFRRYNYLEDWDKYLEIVKTEQVLKEIEK